MMYIYGLDPASRVDYFGIVVQAVEPADKIARLQTLRKIRDIKYPDVYRLLREDLFQKYPPTRLVIDFSNEKTFTELLIERYGKDRVDAINFTQPNKLMLKQDGLKLLQLGYAWPTSKDPKVQSWIDELRDQLKHEQMIETQSGKTTFDHPEGEHNDLAIAWELSAHGALPYLLREGGIPAIASGSMDGDYWEMIKSREQKAIEKATKLVSNRIQGAQITDVKLYD